MFHTESAPPIYLQKALSTQRFLCYFPVLFCQAIMVRDDAIFAIVRSLRFLTPDRRT